MVCALAFIVTGAIIVVYNYTIPYWGAAILISGIALTVVVMAKNKWVISKEVNPVFRTAELMVSIAIAIYSYIQHWKFPTGIFAALSAAILFALYYERSTGGALSVNFDGEGVRLPFTARRRFRPWTEVERVLFRYGTLTINFTDNSFVQWDIPDSNLDGKAFELFCHARVEENRGKRRNDDW